MKKIFITVWAALIALTACEEWQPVTTTDYKAPAAAKVYSDADMAAYGTRLTIKGLAAKYEYNASSATGKIQKLETGWIKGQVISSDASGNIYKSLYIQDETGGIELKLGRTNMSNDYRPGQWVYVNLSGLTLGMYGQKAGNYGGSGMIQIGLADQSGKYETAYMELPLIVDSHVFKGEQGAEVVPVELTAGMLPGKTATQADNKYIGTLVTLRNLTYKDRVFCLVYRNGNYDTSKYNPANRLFLDEDSGTNWGITTWALTKARMESVLMSGAWDSGSFGNGSRPVSSLNKVNNNVDADNFPVLYGNKDYPTIERAACSVSQYFKLGSRDIQVRSSGYARFADIGLNDTIEGCDILGGDPVDMTGILTMYQGSIQFTLIDLDGIKKH